MIRHEIYRDGVCVEAEILDAVAGTVSIERAGVVVETRAMTEDERASVSQPASSVDETL